MKLLCSEFRENEMIPKKYTCDGEDINPPLQISDVPDNARQLALIVDDPDAPSKTWVHWLLYNIPVTDHIDENSNPGTEGLNDFGNKGFGGPCPPSGQHRYYFKLYALDTNLNLEEGLKKEELESVIEGHILEEAHLVGKYSRD